MKPLIPAVALLSMGAGPLFAQSSSVYTNFIRQVDYPALPNGEYTYKQIDNIPSSGSQISPEKVADGGALFQLWATRAAHQTEYLLASSFVGTYVPRASVSIETDDDYTTIPRTRADRSFRVKVTVSGLLSGDTLGDGTPIPEAAKSVNLLRHWQSYGQGGTGENINRDNATLFETVSIKENVTDNVTIYDVIIPASDLTKVRGEERFSVYSLEDYYAGTTKLPASELASKFVQIWPVADGAISGIESGQKVLFAMPQITLTLNDLYPESSTYLQAYKGKWEPGKVGIVVPGSSIELNDTVPKSEVLTLTSSTPWNEILTEDGEWTLELVTKTPFDTVSLDHKSAFVFDSTIEVNSNITTSD
jgi:hypothetical protein